MVVIAQVIMALTLVLMMIQRLPLYTTAVVGSVLAALVAGIPFTSDDEEATTITSLITDSMHPVLADMAGVLLFIGVMEKCGYLQAIIMAIIRFSNRVGGGPGIATGGGIAAGLIGGFTGFTQPAITGAVTGPASVKLGVNPNESAGTHAHAGHLGNFAGFTHPTLLAILAIAGIGFGWINLVGLVTALAIFGFSFFRMVRHINGRVTLSDEETREVMEEFEQEGDQPSPWVAIIPFILLVVGFGAGLPVFAVGFIVSVLVMILTRSNPRDAEAAMLTSVQRIAIPLIAVVGFLFLSSTINAIDIDELLIDWAEPLIETAPIVTMIVVSAVAGFLTQSNAASAAIIVPVATIIATHGGVDPLALAVAAAGPTAVTQYFLTGGPVAALSTTIPVVPGSDLKAANRFQRPSPLVGLAVVVVIALVLGGF
ncbi:MAG: citrate transporter [Mycobacteriaceae bacterium]